MLPNGGETLNVRKFFILIVILILVCFFSYYFMFSNIKNIAPKPLNFNIIKLYQKNELFSQNDWNLSILKLNLKNIPIKDGVDSDTLENYIGHFQTTSYINGNVCLAAHNNGFSNNYFKELYLLEVGDKIEYNYYGTSKVYNVYQKYTINEKDFSVLNPNNKDKLTLITCISGSPQLRLCIEAVSEEENYE